jgi:hypothetical protein
VAALSSGFLGLILWGALRIRELRRELRREVRGLERG